MQAFRVQTDDGSSFYFCSITCATKHSYGIPDGVWLMQDEYDDSEFCANCEIFLDDARRSISVLLGRGYPCGQRERDAKILAKSNVGLLDACRHAYTDINALLACLFEGQLSPTIRTQLKKTADECEAAVKKATE